MHVQNVIKFYKFILKILRGNEISTSVKGHNSVINLWKHMRYNLNLDVFSINTYIKFGKSQSIISQDIEWKWYADINQGP